MPLFEKTESDFVCFLPLILLTLLLLIMNENELDTSDNNDGLRERAVC